MVIHALIHWCSLSQKYGLWRRRVLQIGTTRPIPPKVRWCGVDHHPMCSDCELCYENNFATASYNAGHIIYTYMQWRIQDLTLGGGRGLCQRGGE